VNHEGFAEGDDTFLGSRDTALEEEEVVLNYAIVRETTQGSDPLLGDVVLSGGIVVLVTETNTVDLLIDLRSVVVTILTSTGNREHDLGRMPGTDTGNLSETLVSFPWELLGSPTVSNTLETVALGDGNNIDVLVLFKDSGDIDGLLKETMSILDLIGDGSAVQLDLHEVSLLLTQASLADLSMGKNADNSAVFADAVKLTSSRLATVLGVLLGVAGEGLLLRSVPVLVEPSPELFGKVSSPDGGEGAKTARGLDVSNNANNKDGGCLHNGDGLNNLTFVHFGSWPVEVTNNMGHASLVTHEGGQVHRLFGVIPREGLDFSPMASSTFPWKETQGAVAGSFVLAVTHFGGLEASCR